MNQQESLKKLQDTELEILLVLSDYCSQHSIEWFLDSGTVLGAKRHEGFIPWDDDIDVGMLREDYERFLDLAKRGFPEGYSVHTIENTHGYAALFAKIYKNGTEFRTKENIESGNKQGIFIDIFPYDILSDDKQRRATQIRNAQTWKYVSYLYHARSINVPHKGILGKIEKIACIIAHHVLRATIRRETILDKWERSLLSTTESSTNQWGCLMSSKVHPFAFSDLFPQKTALFCGHAFPIPNNAEKYLTTIYGDWRKQPPIGERKTHLPLYIDFGDGTFWKASGEATE